MNTRISVPSMFFITSGSMYISPLIPAPWISYLSFFRTKPFLFDSPTLATFLRVASCSYISLDISLFPQLLYCFLTYLKVGLTKSKLLSGTKHDACVPPLKEFLNGLDSRPVMSFTTAREYLASTCMAILTCGWMRVFTILPVCMSTTYTTLYIF